MISLKEKRIIIFDLDGTIVDLNVDWDYLKQILSERILEIYGKKCEFIHISACLDYITERKDEYELKNFFKIIEKYEMKNISESKKIEESIFFINNIELFEVPKDIKLAILSLNTRKTIITSLKLFNIYNKFNYIIGREDIRKWKPNPDGLLKIQNHFGVKKKDMVYFGDKQKDIKTGENADIDSYLIEDLIELVRKRKEEIEK